MEQFDITPDFAHVFKIMLRDFTNASAYWAAVPAEHADTVRKLQAILAPLNVAAQSITTAEALEEFRNALADAVAALDQHAAQIESEMEDETDPTDGKGLL